MVAGPFRVAVLISGAGTNLQALLDQLHEPGGEIEIVGVAASRRGRARAERAEAAGVESAVFAIGDHADRGERDRALGDWLEGRATDLVVLAGFMELLSREFIGRFAGRIVNVHPSLLPSFPGLKAIEQAVEYGVKLTGVTVHFVDEGVDSGRIVLQEQLELSYPAAHRRDRGASAWRGASTAAARGAPDCRGAGAPRSGEPACGGGGRWRLSGAAPR